MKNKKNKKTFLTLEFVYKMITTKYEVDPTLELGYLGVKKK